MGKFNHLNVPNHWQHYWTSYPEGYTMLEALLNWVRQVDELTDNVNQWNEYLENFVEGFDERLQEEVATQLIEWRNDGTLDHIIQDVVFQDKANTDDLPYINVRVLGVKGDGTDETTLLNEVLSGGNKRLYFPEGTYGHSDYLRLYKNTNILLHDKATIKHIGSGYKVFINGELGNNSYATGYNGEGNIHFKGGIIDLNWQGSTVAYDKNISAFDLAHGENISFRDMTIQNGQNGHYVQVASCKNVVFENCTFKNQEHRNTSNTSYECIQIEESTEASFPTFGGYDGTPSKDIHIVGCEFDNVIRAVGTHGASTIVNIDMVVERNVFRNVKDHAIIPMGAKSAKIKDNTLENIGAHAFYLSTVELSEISGNTARDIGKQGFYLTGANLNTIKDNALYNVSLVANSYAGFRVANSSNNLLEGNILDGTITNHTYAYYQSDNSLNNQILSNRFKEGTSGSIYGATAEDIMGLHIGAGHQVLHDGELNIEGQTITLPTDARLFKAIVVVGNNNSGTASMLSVFLVKPMLTFGTPTSRYRLIVADSITEGSQVDFSFPTSKQFRVDRVTGDARIRQVVGVY
jgi:hypothetical protein